MISLFFIGILLLSFLWNLYYARHWHTNLTVSLAFLQDYVYAGDRTEMTEQIENRKKMMLPILEVGFHMDRNLAFHDCENTNISDYAYKRDIFALLGMQRVTRRLSLDCKKRGYYRIDKSDLTTFSILHRRRFSVETPADAALYVYAARTDVSDILVTCERLMGSLQCAKRLYEDPFAFSSIREYTLTDPMNTINWKASARTGELMVNTFESTLTEKVMLYLDVEDRGILKYEHLTEDAVSVAASLAQRLIGRGMEVGLCVNAAADHATRAANGITDTPPEQASPFTYIEPAAGRKQLTAIEQALSLCKSDDGVIPFSEFLMPQTPKQTATPPTTGADHAVPVSAATTLFPVPEDAVMILISKNAAQNQAAIEQFAAKTQLAVWVVPYTRGGSCELQTTANVHVIKREVSA